MRETRIKFETAKLAKEKEFDCDTQHHYDIDGEWFTSPTQSQLQKFLRDIHGINIVIIPIFNFYNISLYKYDKLFNENINIKLNGLELKDFNSYEEALEEGLFQGLLLIK